MEAKRLERALFLAVVISFGVAEECIKTAPCECKTSNMSVNLNTLPSFTAKDKAKGSTYFFSPCRPVQELGCKAALPGDVAMCQQVDAQTFYDAGDFNTLIFAGDPAVDNLSLTYTAVSRGVTRTSKIRLICSENARLESDGEEPKLTYNFRLYQDKTGTCISDESGLSVGSVLVILFFVLFIVYWVAGFLFMKFVRRAEGLEVIPNYEFWKELPLLIRDGATFTLRGCKGESTYEKI